METIKISELPGFRSKELLEEAMGRGRVLVEGRVTEGPSVAIVGLVDIVFEMKEELDEARGLSNRL